MNAFLTEDTHVGTLSAMIQKLPIATNALRRKILEMAFKAKGGHVAGALSVVDIVAILYDRILRVDPANPASPERDYFILSKGHACLAQYVVLAEKGFFTKETLETFVKPGTKLAGHATMGLPGVEASTGSLGHGLPMSVGLAYGLKFDKKPNRVFVILSDGECQEGSTWEAIMSASSFNLDNLVAIVDYNKMQSCGPVKDVLPSFEPFRQKWEAFGWAVREVDGHDQDALTEAFSAVPFRQGKPSLVIAHTVKGKGVSYTENVPIWHFRAPNPEEYALAMRELADGPEEDPRAHA